MYEDFSILQGCCMETSLNSQCLEQSDKNVASDL